MSVSGSSSAAAACGGAGGFVGVGGFKIFSNNLIVSFASSCVDCGSIASNGFLGLSSLLILACLISVVSDAVGLSPMFLMLSVLVLLYLLYL